ncbi:MAG: CvpA family protein [Chloroflexota bacterium]
MNWLDIVILAAAGIAIIMGLLIGLIRAVLSLAGLVVGVILAGRFYMRLSELLTFIPQPKIAGVVAFAIILIVVLIIASILTKVFEAAIKAIKLGWINRLGGAAFQVILAGLTISTILAVWVQLFGAPEIIVQSKLATILLDRFPVILTLLPAEFREIRPFFR